jgi:hypothetical protein
MCSDTLHVGCGLNLCKFKLITVTARVELQMKSQMPELKVATPKRLSPELDEILHMLKSLESSGKGVEVASSRG